MANDARVSSGGGRQVPRIKSGADLTQLPLGPTGGFVLSRIDGQTSTEEIAESTGVPVSEVEATLLALEGAGMLEWVSLEDRKPRKRDRRVSSKSFRAARERADSVRTMPIPPGTPRRLYDPQELNEAGVELDVETRRMILDTYYRLSSATLYELLAVPTDSPKAEIRSAYFRLSKLFHPDTRFGKELGSYKQKMEAVFKRLTEAYEILGKKKTRSEYDDYLQIKNRTDEAERSVEKAKREAERIEREVDVQEERTDSESEMGPAQRASARPPTREPGPPETPLAPSSEQANRRKEVLPTEGPQRELSDAARARAKRLMARKLAAASGRGLPNQRPRQSSKAPRPTVPMERSAVLRGLAGSLKQAASHTGGVDRATFQLEQAQSAEKSGNLLAAVNALRLALAISGDRPDIAGEYDRVRGLYAAEMAETFEKQAKYEEKLGQWTEAALSWSKVCEGRPEDGYAHVHAAVALLEAKGDFTQAKRFAERGKALLGDDVLVHRALGRVYYALDMKLSAKRAFEAVLKLDPEDQEIRQLLKEL